jgi:phage tail sheath protein FI
MPNFMWHAARAFFENGGRRLYVARAWRRDGGRPETSDLASALDALEILPDIAIVAAPGSTFRPQHVRHADARAWVDANVQALLAHVEKMRYRMAVVDSVDGHTPDEVRDMRAPLDSSRGALFYPWVRVADPVSGRDLHLPPSGFLAGIYARVDTARGVHRAPGNEAIVLATGLERELPLLELEGLTQAGINCLRVLQGRGVLVWSTRTLGSNGELKYVNVRRLLIFLEHSIDRGTQWAVFEPNAEPLWHNVRTFVENFLTTQWQAGALLGTTPHEAFFVKCDRTTMTQNDLDNGRLICLVGVAVMRPGVRYLPYRAVDGRSKGVGASAL